MQRLQTTEDKTKFCFSCGESKKFQDYHLNKGKPEKFCKSCCRTYAAKERQDNEYKIIFGVITDKIKGDIWEKKF